ncbi:hypothetical protein AA313_de0206143 [Arthrobotrys entomopaga]|nr:hypothetical protein AA313_de0206143 [Arthrobotrys entomopaga]
MHFSPLTFTLPLLLATNTLACLQMTASLYTGLGGTISLTLVDDGVQVCDGVVNGCAGNIKCIGGYQARVDGCHTAMDKGPKVWYKNGHGEWNFDGMTSDCINENCCGGVIPCVCWVCQYHRDAFC